MLVTVSTTQTALSANQQIPLGSTVIQTNREARLNNGNLEIRKAGTFEILANFVFTATAAGDVTVQMQAGGVNVPGATATATAAAGETVTLPVQGTVQTRQGTQGATVPISWTVSAAGTLVSATASVKRVI